MNAEFAASRTRLKEINAKVKHHFPKIDVLQGCWTRTFECHPSSWEFHGPDKFYWKGEAINAYDCLVKGWEAYLKFKGVM